MHSLFGTGSIALTEPTPGTLTATPAAANVELLEQNDVFVVKNVGEETATLTRVVTDATDREAPEFAVSAPGCSSTLAPGGSCAYTIEVNSRPESNGRVTFYYRDGMGGERTMSVDVDIAS